MLSIDVYHHLGDRGVFTDLTLRGPQRRERRAATVLTTSATHREPAPDVSDEEERVVFEVAHHGVAAAQLRGAAVSLVVVANGAVADHSQNKREDPLGRGVGGQRERGGGSV